MNFNKSEKPNEGKILFSTSGAGKTAYLHAIKLTWDSYLTPYTKTNSKRNKDLNRRAKTIKLFKDKIRGTFHDIGSGKDFLDRTPKHKGQKKKMIKWANSQLKSCVHQKTLLTE